MAFFRQEYWSGLAFPTQGDLPDPGIEFVSLRSPALAGRFFTRETPILCLILAKRPRTNVCKEIFILGGSKITADGDYSHEIKRQLLRGRKVMTNLDNILKSRDITLPIKVCLVKAMVFPVVMYGCESWAVKKAEH